ncbi:hypothetical protein [Reichenbachiella versicolor]|uniref:hypothetical protein n=1 Tax=Reichenbachiella versicolor TaxID=1821036 RepID=UPI0013A5B181|nr:hypothetical protein [Reichenbachiella versicolor]
MKRKVLITIKEQFSDDLKAVSDDLLKHSIEIEEAFPFGVITGSVDDEMIPVISQEAYVDNIDLDGEVGIS